MPDAPEEKKPISMDEINAAAKEQVKPVPDFSADFNNEFILTMRIDLKAAVSDMDKYHMLRGFFDNTRDQAFMHIHGLRNALAEQQKKIAGVVGVNGKGGFFGGLDKFLKRK